MTFLKKPWRLFVAGMAFAVFAWIAAPAYSAANQAWELARAFAEAISYQESYYLPYLIIIVIIAALAFLVLAAIVILNRRSKESTTVIREMKSDKNQKRAWFRVPLNMNLLYAPAGTSDFREGRIVDLSGGGLLFTCSQPVKLNDWLRLCFRLNSENKLDLTGRVVRVAEKTESDGEVSFFVGVEFTNIRVREQDQLVSFLLRKQQLGL